MGSLARVLEYDNPRQFNAFPDGPEVSEILSLAQAYLNQGETLRAKIKRVAKMQSEKASILPGFIQQNFDAPFECHAGT
jgi:hypothetical protein